MFSFIVLLLLMMMMMSSSSNRFRKIWEIWAWTVGRPPPPFLYFCAVVDLGWWLISQANRLSIYLSACDSQADSNPMNHLLYNLH
jgi:hypothetical protein